MDGIVPLQGASSASKPISLLKNQIISENAEVLFDPIVPLPSPSKVRPKLRPVPRLAPLRRKSIQGSASESEDDARRTLLIGGGGGVNSVNTPVSRQRHDSQTSHSNINSVPRNRVENETVSSSVSQTTAQQTITSSPAKEKKLYRSRRMEHSQRMAAMRRRRETTKKEALTMYDYIFYNPSSNPIIPDQDELKVRKANKKEEAVRKASKEPDDANSSPGETYGAPVPQIKLGSNGEIILDEQSLIIQQSDRRKVSSDVVHESAWNPGPSKGYRRTPRTASWSDAETVRFYRALAVLGTDFMLMESLFPGRTRRDLKLKYKKEERMNMAQVDKALRTTTHWDAMRLHEEFEAEREQAKKREHEKAEELRRQINDQAQLRRARGPRTRISLASRALGSSVMPIMSESNKHTEGLTADDLIKQHFEAKKKRIKQKKPRTEMSPKPPTRTETCQGCATPARIPNTPVPQDRSDNPDVATIIKLDPTISQGDSPDLPQPSQPLPTLPSNIETGSLVVLTTADPDTPYKKMLQTYIASGDGKLAPIALPPSFLNSVVTYMKKGTPISSMSAESSPHFTSPSSVATQNSPACSTPGVIETNTSPAKRQQHSSSYVATQL